MAIKLCQSYIQQGIAAKDIVVLAGYLAHVTLTQRAVALTPGLEDVDTSTIDAYKGEEKLVVILCMMGSQKLGFMSDSARLLTGVFRVGDALAIITNHISDLTALIACWDDILDDLLSCTDAKAPDVRKRDPNQ